MQEIDKEDIIAFLIICASLLVLGCNSTLPYTKNTPGCFPDYRPGFKCYIWEKLP